MSRDVSRGSDPKQERGCTVSWDGGTSGAWNGAGLDRVFLNDPRRMRQRSFQHFERGRPGNTSVAYLRRTHQTDGLRQEAKVRPIADQTNQSSAELCTGHRYSLFLGRCSVLPSNNEPVQTFPRSSTHCLKRVMDFVSDRVVVIVVLASFSRNSLPRLAGED